MNRQPYVTWFLLLAFGIVFVRFGLHDPTIPRLLAAGADHGGLIAAGEVWRLVSAAFVHIGLLHLAFNAYFLYRIGPWLETVLGPGPFLVLFLVTAAGGNMLAAWVYPPFFVSAGASTSMFGFLGAAIALRARSGQRLTDLFRDPFGRQLISVTVINFAIGFAIPQISNSAHLGGFLSGLVLGACFLVEQGERSHARRTASLPVKAGWLLVGAAALLYTHRPYLHRWFQVRTAWFARGERAVRLDRALARRGVDERTLEFLRVMREMRGLAAAAGDRRGLGTQVRRRMWTLHRRLAGGLADPASVGIDPAVFGPFLAAVDRDPARALRALPEDPWRPPPAD